MRTAGAGPGSGGAGARSARSSLAVSLLAALIALVGCGIKPSGVTDAGEAPTGVAPGMTLYFVDEDDELQPQLRRTQRLGTVSDAVSLLLIGPGGSGMRTGIASTQVTSVEVTMNPGVIELRVPLAADEVTPVGIDQIVCTVQSSHVQNGGSDQTGVRIQFTQPAPESEELRTCPLYE